MSRIIQLGSAFLDETNGICVSSVPVSLSLELWKEDNWRWEINSNPGSNISTLRLYMFLALDKDMNGTLSKQELREGKTGRGNAREMEFESFLDFVLALENKGTPEGITYRF
uniref:EF-hand domain-containing protein n=1 Tax=Lactuca sativa TaxID=4236 RepID=A0A9R1VIV1_LACSA|nr:hypothetical protein LSAT_V11C500230030 [Lactuca sativa]